MKKVAVCSMFRDSMVWHGHEINQAIRYFVQLEAQSYPVAKSYCLEGNSKDNTWQTLEFYQDKCSFPVKLLRQETDYPKVVSIVDPKRIKSMSILGDIVLNNVGPDFDYILWLESDLLIPDTLIQNLVESVEWLEIPLVVAPMIYVQGTENFYDIWGFRGMDGKCWNSNPKQADTGLIEMQSVGSCVLFSASLLDKGLAFGTNGFVSFCSVARELGAHIFANTDVRIWHPKSIDHPIRGRLV